MFTFFTITIVAMCVAIVLFSIMAYLQISASAVASPSKVASLAHSKIPITEIPEQKSVPSVGGTSKTTYYGYTAHVFTDAHGNSLHYYLYVPQNYNPAQKYPLVLLLHGGGERSKPTNTAQQNEKVLLSDPYALVWSAGYSAPGNPHIQQRWPDYFAAAAPIAGAGDPSKASVLKKLPIWAFHGSADTTVPVAGSRDMIAAMQAAGGRPRYTEFLGQGHGIWGFVYRLNGGPLLVTDFYPWLFSQHK